ncbi:uncharacterized protein yc1106_07708 [Curvularia clavata]|uniref:Protein kinase domain-containing protein n=1 Tax=Curvularia clavata TaxID=95742 RepID=A0A9Q8ZFE0_CURCL|nr:uncharacterized protein yc1106_07708 [Curvularia clavata]
MPKYRGHQNQKGVATTTLREIQIMAYEPLRESAPIVGIEAYIWFPFDQVPSLLVQNAFYGTLDNFILVFISHQTDGWTLRHRLCQEIARGLEALHSEGIVHGDVKPQNILVINSSSVQNDPESVITARLTDFGHSSFRLENNGYESYVGTPLFSAPEVLATLYGDSASKTLKREDWPKCDVWSFGLTACCIISSKVNYFQDEWLSAEFSDPPRRIPFLVSQSPNYLTEKLCELIENVMVQETTPRIPEELRTVFLELVKGCLDSDTHRRYSMRTASKLLDIREYYDHPIANFEPTFSRSAKDQYLAWNIESVISVICPWSTKRAVFDGLRSILQPVDDVEISYPLIFGKSVVEYCHSAPESDGSPRLFDLSSCYAYGYGVKFAPESAYEPFLQLRNSAPKEMIVSRLRSATAHDSEPKIGAYSFSEAIREYQLAAVAKRIQSIQSLKVSSNTRDFSYMDVHEAVEDNCASVPDNLQVLATRGTYLQGPLHFAASTNNIRLAEALLNQGYDVNSTDDEDRTALFEACSIGSVEMTLLLLDNGAKASLTDDSGTSPLHLLAIFPREEIPRIASRLLEAGGSIMARTRSNFHWWTSWYGVSLSGTPLHFAVGIRNFTAVETLLELGADPNCRCPWISSLDLAASLCLPEICELLIRYGASAEKHWFSRSSPLHQLGLAFCASIHTKWMIHGSGYIGAINSTIDLLLSHGALIDEEDENAYKNLQAYRISYTPLGLAAANPRTDADLLACLLEKTISMEKPITVDVLFSAIHSSMNDHLNHTAFKMLYQHPKLPWADIPGHKIVQTNGQTILHESAKKDALAIVETILAHPDISIDVSNGMGKTALHIACEWASDECVQLLVQKGADVNMPPSEAVLDTECLYYNPLGLLVKAKRGDLLAWMLDHGGDPWLGSSSDAPAPTLLHLAVSARAIEMTFRTQKPILEHMEALVLLPQEESFLVSLLEGPQSDTWYRAFEHQTSLLNAVSPQLGTALHVATICGAPKAVEALLELGADRNVKDNEGRTAFDCLTEFYRRTRQDYLIVSSDVYDYVQEMMTLLFDGYST